MTNSISFKISHKKDATFLRHSVAFSASLQRIKIRCYKILRAYGSEFPIKLNGRAISRRILDKFNLLTTGGKELGLELSLCYVLL
jgi:hypothetical protein